MLTRRQFLIGMGAVAASTLVSLACGKKTAFSNANSVGAVIPLDCDWVIENVSIIDGTGSLAYPGKVAVKGENIVAVGDFVYPATSKVIDGQGFVLAPGFIDIHTHTEDYVHSGESMAAVLSQGVTMQIGGNCGRSPLDIAGYFQTLPHLAINYGLLIGYATLREAVIGRVHGKTSPAALSKMQEKLAAGLQSGALGLSTGLEYFPQNYATTEELIALCEVVKEYGGFYATHIRSEYDAVLPALEEAIQIGIKANLPVQYSHIKAGYQRNWPKFPKIIEMLEEAKKSGLDITSDVYPYTYSSTDLGIKPLRPSISEENMLIAVTHPLVFYGSDSGLYSGGRASHPRAYGTFPRYLGYIVREKNTLPLEKAIAKMSGEPAKRLSLKDRGQIGPGYKADLVLFDAHEVIDKATFEHPSVLSEGIRQVWVNGQLAWSEGKVLENNKGQVIS